MDAITPVGAMIKPPAPINPIQTLSGLLGLKQQQLALQTGQQQLSSATSQATVAGQTAKENQAGASLLSDPVGNGILDSSGNPTPNAEQIILRAMPTTGATHYSQIVAAAQKKIEFNSAVNHLRSTERAEVGNTVAGAAADPNSTPQSVIAQLKALVQSKEGTPEYAHFQQIASTAETLMQAQQAKQEASGQIIPSGQEAWRQGALQLGRTLLGAAGVVGANGIATPQAVNINLGGKQVQGTQAPALAGGALTQASSEASTLTPQIFTPPGGGPPSVVGGTYGTKGETPGQPVGNGPPPSAVDWHNFGEYNNNLNTRVRIATDVEPIVTETENALSAIRNKAGSSQRAAIAKSLQAMGAPEGLVDAVAGGDLGKTQAAEKMLFQTTLMGLRQAMQGDPARVAEFNEANKVFPNIDTDPRAKKFLLNFIADRAQRDYAEQQALNVARKDGTFNPVTWQGDYQRELRQHEVSGTPQNQVPEIPASAKSPYKAPSQEALEYFHAHPESAPYFKKHYGFIPQ